MSEYVIKIGTVAGRHELPVDYYVLDEIDPYDMFRFEIMQGLSIAEVLKIFDREIPTIEESYGEKITVSIELYVTGLTIATIHVLNAIKAITQKDSFRGEVRVYAMHYDRETEEYHRQWVLL